MRPRQFLATGTALLPVGLAGCGHPAVVLDMNEATAADIGNEASTTAEPGSEEYRVVTSALANESSIRRGRYDLFDRTSTIRIDDSFYNVTETRLESSEVTVYEVLVDLNPANSTPELGAIDFEGLPDVDRERLEPVFIEETPPDQDGYDIGVDYGSTTEVGNNSVFVPERRYDVIIYDDKRYRVAVNSRTAPEAQYRYEATPVADSVEAFAAQVRERYLFELTGLSEAEREVVEVAIEETYFEETDAFRSVVGRLQAHHGLNVADLYGTWLLEYEGVEYLTYAEW